MDGTLLNSIAIVERIWRGWAERNGIDADALLKTIHGVRAVDVISGFSIAGMDAEKEAAALLAEEMAFRDGIFEVPGAVAFLESLPRERWAIVTSAPRELAMLRLGIVGLPVPDVMICAEDIVRGKPDPQGYRMGAERLGMRPENCVVFEDAPAGIEAGEAAGAQVVVITATHQAAHHGGRFAIAGYEDLKATATAGGLRLALKT